MIRLGRHDHVALVTIDRPERRNALSREGCEQLRAAVEEAARAGARALVLTGAGEHFCSGADLSGLEDEDYVATLQAALHALCEVPLATIAAVHGAALGAGTQLAVACDLRVAQAGARFGIPAAKLGLMVDHWTVQRLVMLMGQGPARAVLLAAEELDADEGRRLGLVQRTGGLDEALAWAQAIARLAPLSIAGHKLALNRLEPPVGDDNDFVVAYRRTWSSADAAEGLASFRERRPPTFEGR